MQLSEVVTALSVWRRLEGYTLYFYAIADNDANYVTVCDITGRGLLVAVGAGAKTSAAYHYAKITIDGSVVVNGISCGAYPGSQGLPTMIGFETGCKVEMKGEAAVTAEFEAVVALE